MVEFYHHSLVIAVEDNQCINDPIKSCTRFGTIWFTTQNEVLTSKNQNVKPVFQFQV